MSGKASAPGSAINVSPRHFRSPDFAYRLIDLLVYRLYGLTDEEIDLVEGV